MRLLAVLWIIILLGGCMVGPDYKPPELDVPAAFIYEDKAARGTTNMSWWEQFQDPVLDGLITEALACNRGIKIAAANMEQAAAVLLQARAPLFPQLGYSGKSARERISENSISPYSSLLQNPHSSYQAFADVSWEIDLWGRIRRLSESAQAQLLATEEARRGVILSLVSSVAGDYIQLLGLDDQLRIARATLETYAQSVKLFELRFKYGQVSQMTVEQARSQYETAAAAIPQIEKQISQMENAICILLGRNPGHVKRGKTLNQLQLPLVPAGLPSDLLTNRPDIRQAEQNLISANAQIGAAKALYFPSISLTGALGLASSDLTSLFQGPARIWSYAGTITGPIFTGGAIQGQVKEAESIQKAALLTYEQTVQNSFADVENALVAREKLREQLQAQKRLVTANSEYVRLARLQYEGGYSPYSTVLQAEQQLFPSELNYAQYRAALFGSLVNIYKAMGGGWITTAERLTVHKRGE